MAVFVVRFLIYPRILVLTRRYLILLLAHFSYSLLNVLLLHLHRVLAAIVLTLLGIHNLQQHATLEPIIRVSLKVPIPISSPRWALVDLLLWSASPFSVHELL